MADDPCVFVANGEELPLWPPSTTEASQALLTVPRVLTDLSTPPGDADTLVATARRLAASADALLVGDHQDRPDFPPSVLARLIGDAGVAAWVTLACRDRNRVSLEQELRGLRLDGRATVLCVTGDGRAFDVRPDVSQAFDLDGTRLAGLAASLGLPVAVAETPDRVPDGLATVPAGPEAARWGRHCGPESRSRPRPGRRICRGGTGGRTVHSGRRIGLRVHG